jgi:hypothetical protein
MVAAMTRLAIAAVVAVGTVLAGPASALAAWTWPLHGEVVTAFRNGDDPYAAGQHRGIDIAGRVGAPVVSAGPGLVRFAGTAGSSGSTVSVRSDDGRFDVSYLHLGSIAVRRGARVAAGEALGTVGTTGVRSIERPHLHFGVREAGTRHAYVDPLTLLPPIAAPPARPPQPVPVAAPVPARPAPAPAPIPAPRAPALRVPVPATRRLPAPAPAPVRIRAPVPAALGRRIGATRVPHAPPVAAPARVPEPHRARPGAVPAVRDASMGPARERARPRSEPSEGGPDVGWFAACAGLIAAALALSTGRGDRLAGTTAVPRARLAALLPALAGRGARTRE